MVASNAMLQEGQIKLQIVGQRSIAVSYTHLSVIYKKQNLINCFISSGEYGNYDEMRDKPPIVWIFGTMLSGAFALRLLIKRQDTDYKRILFCLLYTSRCV